MGTDGAQWILEGVYNKKYQVVDRWTPESSDFAKTCDYLFELTDLKIDEREKY